jgi:hypothetical protein
MAQSSPVGDGLLAGPFRGRNIIQMNTQFKLLTNRVAVDAGAPWHTASAFDFLPSQVSTWIADERLWISCGLRLEKEAI